MGKVKEEEQIVVLAPEADFKSGLTFTVFLALLYAIFVFVPSNIYLRLMTGQSVVVAWFVTLLWVEIAKIAGKKITPQEATLILLLSGGIMFVTPMTMVQRDYFVNSDIFQLFGLTTNVPTWYAPPVGSKAHQLRTFFHPDWITPTALHIVWWGFMILLEISLGLLGRELFIEAEDLPFPMQQVTAEGILTVTGGEEKKSRTDMLFTFGVVGFIWGFLVYAFPFVMQAYSGSMIQIIPIPWVDITTGQTGIERILPGAMLGIATDIAPIGLALVLPTNTLITMVASSFAIWIFSNWLIVNNWVAWGLPDINPTLPGVQSWWVPGMNIQLILLRSNLYFWVTPIIGFGLAAGLLPVVRHPGIYVKAIKSLLHPETGGTQRRTRPISYKFIILPYIAAVAVGISFYMTLAPNFPLYLIAPFVAFLPMLITLVNSRMLGETGVTYAGYSELTRLVVYASGYPGVDMWFVPQLQTSSGVGWLGEFKVAQLTKTTIDSVIKAFLIIWPIAALVGYLYMQMFWSLAPIPSGLYPGASIFWPIDATFTAIWITGRELNLFNPTWLIISFAVGAVLYLVIDATALPISIIAIAAGMAPTNAVPFAVAYLVGIVVKLVIQRAMGKDWYAQNRMICSAGLVMGQSISVAIAIAISLVLNSIWKFPI